MSVYRGYEGARVNVRFGSEADIARRPRNVRVTPIADISRSGSLAMFAAIRLASSLVSPNPRGGALGAAQGFTQFLCQPSAVETP